MVGLAIAESVFSAKTKPCDGSQGLEFTDMGGLFPLLIARRRR
jgi:hypothetical protein